MWNTLGVHGCVVLLLPFLFISSAGAYSVSVKRLNNAAPIVSSRIKGEGGSSFLYNYNAAFVPLDKERGALLVRCQSLRAGAKTPYDVGPSMISYARIQTPTLEIAKGVPVVVDFISENSVVIEPKKKYDDTFGTEDPRVALDESTGDYYILFSAVENTTDGKAISRLALSTSREPAEASSYEYRGPLFPSAKWSKSGALLIREKPTPSLLFWGDSTLQPGLHVATSENLLNYTDFQQLFLHTRNESFDSRLVEAGPPPMKLSDGNYIFVYNSARSGFPSKKPGYDLQYNVGYAILSKDDPTKVLQRSDHPILSPVLDWEKGDNGALGLTPNVVFCEGMARVGPNAFVLFYGAADSCVGAALLTIHL